MTETIKRFQKPKVYLALIQDFQSYQTQYENAFLIMFRIGDCSPCVNITTPNKNKKNK